MGDVGVVVDNVGVVTLTLPLTVVVTIVVTVVAVITLGRSGLLVRILLYFRHRIDLSVIKRFEVSAAGLVVGGEMQIPLRALSCCPHPGGQGVVRMVARHPASSSETLGTENSGN